MSNRKPYRSVHKGDPEFGPVCGCGGRKSKQAFTCQACHNVVRGYGTIPLREQNRRWRMKYLGIVGSVGDEDKGLIDRAAELEAARARADGELADLVAAQRYLVWTQAQVGRWGFDYAKLLVWAKPPTGFSLGGAFGNSCEFVVYAKRGKPETHGKVPRDWWEWSRHGHSVKPEAFLDIVESVCPGPYLEMFARRQRLGWDTWGNEALEHVELAS